MMICAGMESTLYTASNIFTEKLLKMLTCEVSSSILNLEMHFDR